MKEDIFWGKMERSEAPLNCWLWTGAKEVKGYGKTTWQGKGIKTHRLAWLLAKGTLPKLQVLHTCDTPLCCNPAHLYLGTDADNMQDKVKRNRQAKGNDFSSTKLTPQSVEKIRTTKGYGSGNALAKEFNVNKSTISQIRNNKFWKWL